MALVVLAHERMAKAALSDQSIKTSRQSLKSNRRWGLTSPLKIQVTTTEK
ncbi:hypothetical protein AURDEDRAFT_176529 [Auricularia subglabra TFB-10046 SS5]|uniref:Uncharacterized protein n=1 Tax=Auricularia subglabra (strain TFB-10046 / SS5) TaxID=717982 RepID=J0LD08_AURST|nr:hypothetical protein AURDEDRAFT_176529 [Auricularia subglabra TFB-10046 SS5]